MIERTCNHCGDTVYLTGPGERLEGYESPLEHFERTGHAFNEPEVRTCENCEYVWPYTGENDRPTCPNCKGKRTVEVN